MFGSFLSSGIHHLVKFEALIQRGFLVIQKSIIDNLYKVFHDIIMI